MKKIVIIICVSLFIISCNNNATDKINSNSNDKKETSQVTKTSPELVFNDGAGGPEIKFDMEVWEFGEINEGDVIDTIFTFTNDPTSTELIICTILSISGESYSERPTLILLPVLSTRTFNVFTTNN